MGTFYSIFFPAPFPSYHRKQLINGENNNIYILQQTGNTIAFVFLPHLIQNGRSITKKSMIFFHGNAQDLGYSLDFLNKLRTSLKINVFAIQYPGYGALVDQKFSHQKMKQNSVIFYDFLNSLGFDDKDIMIMGRSIGSGPASYLSSKRKATQLVLMSPFRSIQGVTSDHTFCCGCIVQEMFPNEEYLLQSQAQLLVIHGKEDKVIPVHNSEKLQEIYKSGKKKGFAKFIYQQKMTHNEFRYREDIMQPINAFLTKNESKMDYETLKDKLDLLEGMRI